MKKLIFALMLCVPLSFFGQISADRSGAKNQKTTKMIPVTYAEVVLMDYGPKKQKIVVNFGAKDVKSLKYSKAAQMEHTSLLDALNAMAKEGYEVVDTYEIMGEKVKEHHFLLARKTAVIPPRPAAPGSVRTSAKTKKK